MSNMEYKPGDLVKVMNDVTTWTYQNKKRHSIQGKVGILIDRYFCSTSNPLADSWTILIDEELIDVPAYILKLIASSP